MLEILSSPNQGLQLLFLLTNFVIAEQQSLTFKLPLKRIEPLHVTGVLGLESAGLLFQLCLSIPDFLELLHDTVGVDVANFQLPQQIPG